MADEFTMTQEFADRTAAAVKRVERLKLRREPAGFQQPRETTPVVFMLLEELHGGSTADAAVLGLQESHETQVVTIVGGTGPGDPTDSFRLRWDLTNVDGAADPNAPTSGPITRFATADEFAAALALHPAINSADIFVQGGGELSRWLVRFQGRYEGQEIPLLHPVEDEDNRLTDQASVEVSGTTELEEIGEPVTLRAVIPTDTLAASRNGAVTRFTPLRRGAIGVAIFVPGFGYIPVAIEPREFFIEAESY